MTHETNRPKIPACGVCGQHHYNACPALWGGSPEAVEPERHLHAMVALDASDHIAERSAATAAVGTEGGQRDEQRRSTWPVTAVLAVAVAAAGAGCSSGEAPTSTPSVTTSASAPADDVEAAKAWAAALAAYDGYRRAQVAAMATSDVSGGDLRRYTADPLLTQVRLTLQEHQQQGLINTGKPSWSPRVTQVDIATQPRTVRIEDCFDNGTWGAVRKSTGESVSAPGQTRRYVVVAKAVLYDDGRWLIQSAQAQRERPC